MTDRPSLVVLCAGDRFITADALADAATTALGTIEVVRHTSSWPDVPFRSVAGVREAAGDIDELVAAARGADLLLTHLAPVTFAVLEAAAPTLRLIGSVRGGPVNIDLDAATRYGVPVAFLPGRNLEAVAEFVIGAMIGASRGTFAASRSLRDGVWDASAFRIERCGKELRVSTVGLVGLGAVGRRVAALLQAFGSTVLAHDPYADPEAAAAAGVELVSFERLLADSDVVSVHARLTDQTRRMFDADAFAAMRRGVCFVNTARGELVDEQALAAALASGQIGSVALDVFDPEPPDVDSPLLGHPAAVGTPHLAGASQQVALESAAKVAAAAAGYLRGEGLVHCANPTVLARG